MDIDNESNDATCGCGEWIVNTPAGWVHAYPSAGSCGHPGPAPEVARAKDRRKKAQ
jgi:hypothetical protein